MTTEPGLVRASGDAVRPACEGGLIHHYTEEGDLLRARWERWPGWRRVPPIVSLEPMDALEDGRRGVPGAAPGREP